MAIGLDFLYTLMYSLLLHWFNSAVSSEYHVCRILTFIDGCVLVEKGHVIDTTHGMNR
jgi:hypothetical protein